MLLRLFVHVARRYDLFDLQRVALSNEHAAHFTGRRAGVLDDRVEMIGAGWWCYALRRIFFHAQILRLRSG
jgi:hypothetical protein